MKKLLEVAMTHVAVVAVLNLLFAPAGVISAAVSLACVVALMVLFALRPKAGQK